MFNRSVLIPTLVACVIAAPFIFSSAKHASENEYQAGLENGEENALGQNGFYLPSFNNGDPNGSSGPFLQTGATNSYQNAPLGNPAIADQARFDGIPVNPALQNAQLNRRNAGSPPSIPLGTPDYGATQTLVFPGDANGPDLSAGPLDFVPVTNFAEIFRFDIDPNWIKRRWKRVSTSPGQEGLQGYRVALVTGTNSWDLHGSLTYLLDQNQQVQRITFQGWTGDASRLVKMLTDSFDFQQQPTQLAGYYLCSSWGRPKGGLLLKNPPVIYAENPIEQVALMLEINKYGKYGLSSEFQALINGSSSSNSEAF